MELKIGVLTRFSDQKSGVELFEKSGIGVEKLNIRVFIILSSRKLESNSSKSQELKLKIRVSIIFSGQKPESNTLRGRE